PPTSEKMSYIAVFTLITQISAFIAPMFGMWLYTQMGYVAFMILTGIARIVVSILYFLVANYEDEIKEIEAK
ncbi:MAG TPA: MFS transporter, partial [Thermoanaerobacter sp.]|nr:MFS transporter [Thermoanaerobacter sp.]